MNLNISNKSLDELDMEGYAPYVAWCPGIHATIFVKQAGVEHYRLFSYIAMQLAKDDTVVDIGTFFGASALAFAMNKDIRVITYDIVDNIAETAPDGARTIYEHANIDSRIKDCTEDTEILAGAKVILIDVNPHDGIKERYILEKIRKSGFKGILLLDDIHLNPAMEEFWSSIAERKEDITAYGHWSGTGIVYFSDEHRIQFL